MKNTLFRVLVMVLFLGGGTVQATQANTAMSDPQDVVKRTTEQVLETLRTEGDTLRQRPDRLYQIIKELILPNFDFRQMSQWVLGRYWRDASDAQRDEFTRQFEQLLVRTYSDALVEFRNQTVEFLPTRERSDTEVTVRAKINQGGGLSVPITYEMHKVADAWKVYDVSIEGVSLVINYRSSFAQEIKRNGIDGLIQRLADKNKSDRA